MQRLLVSLLDKTENRFDDSGVPPRCSWHVVSQLYLNKSPIRGEVTPALLNKIKMELDTRLFKLTD